MCIVGTLDVILDRLDTKYGDLISCLVYLDMISDMIFDMILDIISDMIFDMIFDMISDMIFNMILDMM